MMFRVLFLTSLFATASGQGCSVCGEGREVTAPMEIFMFAGQPSVPCGDLQNAGEAGSIPIASCPFLPGLIGVCACDDIVIPTPAPIAPTPAPVIAAGGCPPVPDMGCSICGDGQCVTNPAAVFSFPGQPEVACSALQSAGLVGQIPLDQCGFLPNLITDCGCAEGTAATPAPIAPTAAPVDPTAAPIAPTPAPVVVPTNAPITAAPLAPIAPTPFPIFILTPSPVEATAAPMPEDSMGMGMGGGMGSKEKKGMSEDQGDNPGGSTMGMSMRSRKLTSDGVAPGIRGI